MFTGLADVYVTGQPVINATINEAMVTDNILLIPLVIVVVLVILFFSFRNCTFVILPLLTVVTAVVPYVNIRESGEHFPGYIPYFHQAGDYLG